jgi:hypothetical protein
MRQAERFLFPVFAVAVVVSIVHYVDNTVNYADYPQADPGTTLASVSPSQTLVGAGWFVFTAFGVLGLWLWRRGRLVPAAVAIALYSGSGLVGFAHYAVPGATDMVWWRQVHVVADIVCGVLLFGFALWAVVRLRPSRASRDTAR